MSFNIFNTFNIATQSRYYRAFFAIIMHVALWRITFSYFMTTGILLYGIYFDFYFDSTCFSSI